jgi:hypothetical protein
MIFTPGQKVTLVRDWDTARGLTRGTKATIVEFTIDGYAISYVRKGKVATAARVRADCLKAPTLALHDLVTSDKHFVTAYGRHGVAIIPKGSIGYVVGLDPLEVRWTDNTTTQPNPLDVTRISEDEIVRS